MLSYVIYCKPVNIIMKNTHNTNKWKEKPLKNVIKKQNNNIQNRNGIYIDYICYFHVHIRTYVCLYLFLLHTFQIWIMARIAVEQLIVPTLESFYGHTSTQIIGWPPHKQSLDIDSGTRLLHRLLCSSASGFVHRVTSFIDKFIGKIKENCAV